MSSVWAPELRHFLPDVPIVLVGTTDPEHSPADVACNNNEFSFVTTKEGRAKAKQIGAQRFLECDLGSADSVAEVINEACRAALGLPPKRETEGCCLQ